MDGRREAVIMAELVYLTGAVYIAVTVARLTFWAVDMVERKR